MPPRQPPQNCKTEVWSPADGSVNRLSPGLAFLNHLMRMGLLKPNMVDKFLAQRAERLAELDTAESLGESLVRANLLTQYQFDRVMAGTTHGLVLGNYRILNRLGSGAMGIVFLGEHTMMNRRAAVKVMPVDEDSPRELLERFYAEMQVLAQLHHPNVVMAFDSGKLESTSVGLPTLLYLVMELVDGSDLEQHVLDSGPVEIGKACNWISQAACGLQEAHNHRLIHRDVKPSNMLLTKTEQVKLVDFGLVRQFALRLTEPKALLGTIEFMAPEQSHDPTAVSSHADIYALGATLFWLLTGETPYPRQRSVSEALKQLQSSPPRPLRTLRPDAPPELEAVLERLLERNPIRRPATPLAVKRYLQPFAAASMAATFVD
jgi:serine/threonine protein kinase